MNTLAIAGLALFAAAAAGRDGASIYKADCAMCHDNPAVTRAPSPEAMRRMSPENILKSLESGLMKEQGAKLALEERRAIAEFLAARAIGTEPAAVTGMCVSTSPFSLTGAAWNGWGVDLANSRFQPAAAARLTAPDFPKLKLKWAFAFPNTFIAYGPPSLAGGRIFVPSANRSVYSLDAKTGCQYWSFEAASGVRTAVVVAAVPGGAPIAFFGDSSANAYAVDAATGKLLWRRRIDEHPRAKIVGAAAYHNGRVYVPLTAGEEGPAMNPQYECCSGRGGLIALDARSGEQIWKTYTIDEEPKPTKKNSEGAQMWGPSGSSIWSAPTIDVEKQVIYATTGDNFSNPATKTSDAVMAFDMKSGKVLWTTQLTANDVYNMACGAGRNRASCPDTPGPDFDFGASAILAKLPNGKRVLLLSQKSGFAHGVDPDANGKVLWSTALGKGGTLGGLQWGSAFDGRQMYAAVSDIRFLPPVPGGRRAVDPKAGGGLHAVDPATGKTIWSAPPPDCGTRPNCSPAQSAAVSAIPGVVLSGSIDAHLRAYSAKDGSLIWDYDTARDYTTVNGIAGKGGSMDGPGPIVADGMLYFCAGYGNWGGLTGNVLLAFSIDGR